MRNRCAFSVGWATAIVLLAWCDPAWSLPEYSGETGTPCSLCHENPDGGVRLTARGEAFRAAGYELVEGYEAPWWERWGRFILGLVHVLGAFLWLGAIFYVHLFMGPRSLSSGLPKGEVRLGRFSMLAVALSGIGLAILRLDSASDLISSTFGVVLLVKIALFCLMVLIAAVTTVWIDRILKREASSHAESHANLVPTEFVYDGKVFDVAGSELWKDGVHMGRHRTGQDLTDQLVGAPHGAEVMSRVGFVKTQAGQVAGGGRGGAMRLFSALANTALVIAFLLVLCVTYWRFGPSFF